MFGVGWVGGRLRSRDQTNSECGSDLVNFSPNPVLSFFGMDFALKFGGED